MRAIHLHDEPRCRREEVADVAANDDLSTVVAVTGSTPVRFSVSYVTTGHVMARTKLCGEASSVPFDYSATPTSFSVFAEGSCGGPMVLHYTKQP